jgi:hypothetical protein
MAINKTNIQSSSTQVARGGSEVQKDTAKFNEAVNSSKSTSVSGKKIAFAPVALGWLAANSSWLVPAAITFIGAVGTALTWDKAAKALQDLFSGNPQVEGLTATQVSQLKRSIRTDKRAKNAPLAVKKMLMQAGVKPNVMQTNAGEQPKIDPSGFPSGGKTPLKDQSEFPVEKPPGNPQADQEALDDITGGDFRADHKNIYGDWVDKDGYDDDGYIAKC